MLSVCLFVSVCRFCTLDTDWFAASVQSLITCEVAEQDVDEHCVLCLPSLALLFVI